MTINIIQCIHILNEFLLSFYFLIFPQKYDKYFVLYLLIITLHWFILKNECILSYIEKKIINKDYKLGSDPYRHPYKTFFSKNINIIFSIMKFINIIYVLYRNKDNMILSLILLIILFISIYFYIDSMKNK